VSRLLARLRWWARSAGAGLRGSPFTSLVAVATIAITLLLVGAFALLVANMEALLERFGDELRLSAYLEEGLDAGAEQALAEQARGLPGVAAVTLVGKAEALARFRASVGGGAALLEGLDENPLPASLEVLLAPEQRSPGGLAAVAERLRALPGVDDLAYGFDWVEGYTRALALVRGVGSVIGAVLALAALLIVANTIRLAVYARRDEIEILLLVGASRSFVAIPFLLEGCGQGALGGGLAAGVLYAVYRLTLPVLGDALAFLMGSAEPQFLGGGAVLALVACGAGLGVIGSCLALLQGWRS
jgi:cell division transport system permease protein